MYSSILTWSKTNSYLQSQTPFSININQQIFNFTHQLIQLYLLFNFATLIYLPSLYSFLNFVLTFRLSVPSLLKAWFSLAMSKKGSHYRCLQEFLRIWFIKIRKYRSNFQRMDIESDSQTQLLKGIFTNIQPSYKNTYSQHQITLKNTFFTNNTLLHEDVLLTLVGNCVLVSEVTSSQTLPFGMVELSFDLKFQVFYLEDKNIRSPKIGFKLFFDKERHFSFFSKSSSVVDAWVWCLSKRLNQIGFHQMFKPTKKIGKGNFASVYEVDRLTDNKKFAVKAFSKHACYHPKNGKQSLINELNIMRILSQDQHSNVLQLQAVFQSDNSVYVVLELLTGPQFFNQIQQRKGQFKSSQIKQFMFGLIHGLAQLHNNRILHRDIKPQNIMLRSKDSMSPVIVDFGLATLADLQKYIFFRCGTPGYVAPQIVSLNQCKHVEPQCDMFSAGVIFHIMLVRKPLFEGTSYEEVFKKNKEMNINLKHERYAHVENVALDLLSKMIQADPKQRLTASQALKHPYFIGYTRENSPVKQVPSPVLTTMSNNSSLKGHLFIKK